MNYLPSSALHEAYRRAMEIRRQDQMLKRLINWLMVEEHISYEQARQRVLRATGLLVTHANTTTRH